MKCKNKRVFFFPSSFPSSYIRSLLNSQSLCMLKSEVSKQLLLFVGGLLAKFGKAAAVMTSP